MGKLESNSLRNLINSDGWDILMRKLEETIEYSWDVDTYIDEYGDEVADDEDLDYYSADTKTSYKLIRK